MKKNKNILMISLIIGLSLILTLGSYSVYYLINNSAAAKIKKIEKYYSIDLPDKTKIEYETEKINAWYGDGIRYKVLKLEKEPSSEFIKSFECEKSESADDYDRLKSEIKSYYITNSSMIAELNIPKEYMFDLEREFHWHQDIMKYFPDSLILYFPATLRLIICEIRINPA